MPTWRDDRAKLSSAVTNDMTEVTATEGFFWSFRLSLRKNKMDWEEHRCDLYLWRSSGFISTMSQPDWRVEKRHQTVSSRPTLP